jgi:hypothetical protein
MKQFLSVVAVLVLIAGMSACVSPGKAKEEAVEFQAAPEAVALKDPVTGASGNKLSGTVGPVTIVVDKDTSFTSNDAVQGATVQMVEFLGKKALKVTSNKKREIRVAFVLDKPKSVAGLSTLEFTVAGFSGGEGTYNCGLLYTSAKDTGERAGSFYVGRISDMEWTSVSANLGFDEQWGKNFSPDKELYCIQFWSGAGSTIYIADLALK